MTHVASKDVPYVWNINIWNTAFEDSCERLLYRCNWTKEIRCNWTYFRNVGRSPAQFLRIRLLYFGNNSIVQIKNLCSLCTIII